MGEYYDGFDSQVLPENYEKKRNKGEHVLKVSFFYLCTV